MKTQRKAGKSEAKRKARVLGLFAVGMVLRKTLTAIFFMLLGATLYFIFINYVF